MKFLRRRDELRRLLGLVVILFQVPINSGPSASVTRLPTDAIGSEQRPENASIVSVQKRQGHPEMVCVQISAGQENIHYGVQDLQLQRRWFGLFWSTSLHLSEFFRFGPTGFHDLSWIIGRDQVSDQCIADPAGRALSGHYRVRLCYYVVPEEQKQQCVYSEAISFS
jgi:hypothetical protein